VIGCDVDMCLFESDAVDDDVAVVVAVEDVGGRLVTTTGH
jgi:hypothetical protein